MNEPTLLIHMHFNLVVCFRRILLTPDGGVEHDCRVRLPGGG